MTSWKSPLEKPSKYEDNIEMNLQETDCELRSPDICRPTCYRPVNEDWWQV